MEILEKLFGSAAKVKVIKLFLFNPEIAHDIEQVADWAKISEQVARKEIYNLEKIGFLKSKFYTKEVKRQKNRTIETFRKRANGWILDPKFPYLDILEAFLSNINPLRHKEMIDKISRAGKIQLLIISGVLIKNPDSRVDLFVVGDNINETLLDNIVRTIESEIGKELKYVVFETQEFQYRISVFDKLISDVLDFPHEKIINKLNL